MSNRIFATIGDREETRHPEYDTAEQLAEAISGTMTPDIRIYAESLFAQETDERCAEYDYEVLARGSYDESEAYRGESARECADRLFAEAREAA